MHRARFLIVLVVALALPLQGIAAATMQLCAPHLDATVASVSPHDATVAADASAQALHHHHHASARAKIGGSESEQHSHAGAIAKSKCSVCAACCAGAALPASSIQFGEAAPAQALVSTFQSPALAFLTAGLERPPRTFPA